MRKLFVVILLTSLSCKSQSFKLLTGDTFKISHSTIPEDYVGYDNQGYYYRNWTTMGYVIYKINGENGRLQYKLNPKGDHAKNEFFLGPNYEECGTFLYKSKIMYFFDHTDKSQESLVLTEFDAATGQPVGPQKTFMEISSKGYNNIILDNSLVNFDVAFSADSSKMVLVSERKKDGTEQEVTIWVYEPGTSTLLWQGKAPTVFRNSTISSSDYQVNNNGTVYFLFSYLRSNDLEDVVEGIGMLDNGGKSAMYPLPESGKTFNKTILEVDSKGVSCDANYLGGEKSTYYINTKRIGLVHIQLSPELQPVKESFVDLNTFVVSLDAIRLSYYDYYRSYSIGGDKYVLWQYSNGKYPKGWSGDVLVMKYDSSGNFVWFKRVPRSTYGHLTGMVVVSGSNLRFIYYEHKKNQVLFPDLNNVDAKKYKLASNAKKSSLISVSMDSDGNMKREILTLGINPILPIEYPSFLNNPGKGTYLVKTYATKNKVSFGILSQ